jgi:hypothetical protein
MCQCIEAVTCRNFPAEPEPAISWPVRLATATEILPQSIFCEKVACLGLANPQRKSLRLGELFDDRLKMGPRSGAHVI